MRVLLVSHTFAPAVGGIETVSKLLAEQFAAKGHRVDVVTETAGREDRTDLGYQIYRRPSAGELLRLVGAADLVFHNNISLAKAWPLLIRRKPWVVAHQTWIARADGSLGWQDKAKRAALRRARSISISRAIAADLPCDSELIPNPYDDRVFHLRPEIPREGDFVFVGRLVSDKGVDLLIRAFAGLCAELRPGEVPLRLKIIGSGPDEASLRALALKSGHADQIEFAGTLQGEELAVELNRHRILVVPSRWREPFGVVALEGIACGCAIVGSAAGGLPDAIGPCGLTFPNGDVDALQATMRKMGHDAEVIRNCPGEIAVAHLSRHRAAVIAEAYLEVFSRQLLASRKKGLGS